MNEKGSGVFSQSSCSFQRSAMSGPPAVTPAMVCSHTKQIRRLRRDRLDFENELADGIGLAAGADLVRPDEIQIPVDRGGGKAKTLQRDLHALGGVHEIPDAAVRAAVTQASLQRGSR